MTNDKSDKRRKQERWHEIGQREQAVDKAAEEESEQVIEHNGVIAIADEVDGQDDEWAVMDECPDELQFGR